MRRIEWEKTTVRHMIVLWCLKKHEKQELCEECRELLIYATTRLDRCKFGDRKTKCHNAMFIATILTCERRYAK